MSRKMVCSGRKRIQWGIVPVLALFVLAAVLPAGAAELTKVEAALNCNSDIDLRETGVNPMDPTRFMVMIEVTSVESNDFANMPQPQEFSTITFFPSCTTTVPCAAGAPMGAPAGAVLSFVAGSASSNCMGVGIGGPVLNPPVDMGTSVEFSFTPALALLNPGPEGAMVPADQISCDIFFEVEVVDPSVTATYLMEATTSGVCQVAPPFGPLNSNTTGTDDLPFAPVPTMGQWALAALALLLLVAASARLSRREQSLLG